MSIANVLNNALTLWTLYCDHNLNNSGIENSFKDAENVPILLTSIVSQSGNSTPKGLFLFISSWIFIKVSPSLVW